MKIYIDYISYILKRCKKTVKDYILVQAILSLLAIVTSFIAIYLMTYPGGYKAGIIIGILEFVPIIGSGLYLCYQIIFNIFSENYLIAVNLGVLYLTILSVRLILEPVLLGRKLNLKVLIFVVIGILFRILGPKWFAFSIVLIFILNTLIILNDIYNFDRKRKIKERKEKREQRERNRKANSENIEV